MAEPSLRELMGGVLRIQGMSVRGVRLTSRGLYDGLGLLARTTESPVGWEPARASFEAAWGPDGAMCLARTRDGEAVETVLAECPGRFEAGEEELGEGDRCTVRRKGGRAGAALLRNHSYERAASSAPGE